jgi:hypothetical protein
VEDIEADLKTLGVREWRRKLLDKDELKDVLEETMALRGMKRH